MNRINIPQRKMKNNVVLCKTQIILISIICLLFVAHLFYAIREIVLCDARSISDNGYEISIEDASVHKVPCKYIEQTFMLDGKTLEYVDLMFDGIRDGQEGYIGVNVYKNEYILWSGKTALTDAKNGEWERIYLGIVGDYESNYTMTISSEETDDIPDIYVVDAGKGATETQNLYVNNVEYADKSLALRFVYKSRPLFKDFLFETLIYFLVAGFCCVIIISYETIICKIKNIFAWLVLRPVDVLVFIITMSCCGFAMRTLGIDFQKSTKGVIYVLSVIGSIDFSRRWEYMKRLHSGKGTFIFVILYFAFAICGSRSILLPINSPMNGMKVACVFATVVWVIPLIVSAYYVVFKYKGLLIKQKEEGNIFVFLLIIIFLLLFPAVIACYAYNPGISSPDTIASVYAAHNLIGSSDWFPPFYYLYLKVGFIIWDNVYIAVIEQYIFWIFVFTRFFLLLRKFHVKDAVSYIVAAFIGMNASNFLFVNTIWKDIPYCCSIVWLTIILIHISIDKNNCENKIGVHVELVIALVCTCLFRKNGIVPFALTGMYLLVLFVKSKKKVLTVFISVTLFICIQFLLYNMLNIEKDSSTSMYLGFGHDIVGVYKAGGELSSDALNFVTQISKGDNNHSYDPTYYPYSHCRELETSIKKYICIVIDTALKNPKLFIKNTIAREDLVWDLFKGKVAIVNNVNYHNNADNDEYWKSFAPQHVDNRITHYMSRFTEFTVNNQLLNIITWRCGIYTMMVVFSVGAIILGKINKKTFLSFAPLIGQILGLWIACGWGGEYRYFWPINLMGIVILISVLVILNDESLLMQNDNI